MLTMNTISNAQESQAHWQVTQADSQPKPGKKNRGVKSSFLTYISYELQGKQGGQVFILDRFRPSVKNEDPYVFLTL